MIEDATRACITFALGAWYLLPERLAAEVDPGCLLDIALCEELLLV